MYTEVFFLSRSLWLVVLMRTMEDALNPLISEGFAVIPLDKTLLISPTFGAIPLMIYLGINGIKVSVTFSFSLGWGKHFQIFCCCGIRVKIGL